MFIVVSAGRHAALVQSSVVNEREMVMSRFSMVLAAALATAMIVIAITTLDAVGADKRTAQSDLTARLANCLRDRGVAVPEVSSPAVERWLDRHDVPEPIARDCKMQLAGAPGQVRAPDEVREADKADAEKLAACLKARGFDAPSDPVQLKRWIITHHQEAILKECGMGPAPGPACGETKPAPADGADAKGLAEAQ
jgi:hypothetical protein